MNNTELKTSKEWNEIDKYKKWTILDPDGWDRDNYQYSFHEELIAEEEFNKRIIKSTITTLPTLLINC